MYNAVKISDLSLRFSRLWFPVLGGLFAAALTLGSANVTAEVYKWTDAEGRVHFSDQPPESGAEEVIIRTPSTPHDPHVVERRERQKKLLQSYDEDRDAQAEVQAKQDKQRREREAKCRHARAELKRMRKASYLFDTQEDGERRIFTDEERAKAEKDWQEAVDFWCN